MRTAEALRENIAYWQAEADKLAADHPRRAGILSAIENDKGELAVLESIPDPTPESLALQAKAQEQRQIAANMRAQATADEILKTLPTDPTPDDHDAIAEKLEVAAREIQ